MMPAVELMSYSHRLDGRDRVTLTVWSSTASVDFTTAICSTSGAWIPGSVLIRLKLVTTAWAVTGFPPANLAAGLSWKV